MLKKGDKVLCIKDIHHYHTNAIRFKEGEWYEIKKIDNDCMYLIPEDEKRECFVNLNTEKFITLAEWREQQINSIFEDGDN